MPRPEAPSDRPHVLGERLRHMREASALKTRERLAAAAGVSVSSIVRAERSEPDVTWETASKIAAALEIRPSEIWHQPDPDLEQAQWLEGVGLPMPGRESTAPPWFSQFAEQQAAALARLEAQNDVILHELRKRP